MKKSRILAAAAIVLLGGAAAFGYTQNALTAVRAEAPTDAV